MTSFGAIGKRKSRQQHTAYLYIAAVQETPSQQCLRYRNEPNKADTSSQQARARKWRVRATSPLHSVKANRQTHSSPEASWHTDYRDTAFVYFGGLPYELSEGDVVTIFSQYGEPVFLKLARDKETGKSKGFGWLKYEDQRSTDLAVDNLGGATISGRMVRVDHARYKLRDDEDPEEGKIGWEDIQRRERDGAADTEEDRGSEDEEQQRRPLLKEERELALLIRENDDDDDPMKAFLIEEKKKEVDEALRREERRRRKHGHRHRHQSHHRSGREDSEEQDRRIRDRDDEGSDRQRSRGGDTPVIGDDEDRARRSRRHSKERDRRKRHRNEDSDSHADQERDRRRRQYQREDPDNDSSQRHSRGSESRSHRRDRDR